MKTRTHVPILVAAGLILVSAIVAPGRAQTDAPGAPDERLANERAYQQDLAKRRAMEARHRARLAEETRDLAPAAKFRRFADEAAHLASEGEFQRAIAILDDAMSAKPADLPVPEDVLQLRSLLKAQSLPLDVTFKSDGATYVTIRRVRMLGRFEATSVRLPPGNYEIVGRRHGYAEVQVQLRLRAEAAPPAVMVACREPLPAEGVQE